MELFRAAKKTLGLLRPSLRRSEARRGNNSVDAHGSPCSPEDSRVLRCSGPQSRLDVKHITSWLQKSMAFVAS